MGCVCISEYSSKNLGKNEVSLKEAVEAVSRKLRKELYRLNLNEEWMIEVSKEVTISEIVKYIEQCNKEFGFINETAYINTYFKNKKRPDGGVIWLSHRIRNERYPILISEMKYQGTNKGRIEAGKEKQACGNAVERLGVYVNAFRPLYVHDKFFPFVTFVCGCDFNFDESGRPLDSVSQIQGAKLAPLVDFRPFNVAYTRERLRKEKLTGICSIFARESVWSTPEMIDMLYEIGLDSFNYFVAKIMGKNTLGSVSKVVSKRKRK